MSFDLLAPHYRWLEWLTVGEKLQLCRTCMLDSLPIPNSVLVYGEGNGRFLIALRQRFSTANITVVDLSSEMIRLTRGRLNRAGLNDANVTFVHADALAWQPPDAAFDLIVTCFFLDCFREDQLAPLIPRIASAATDDARWLLADFQIAASGWRRWRSQIIVWLLYRVFRMLTRLPSSELCDSSPLFTAAGFVRETHEEQDQGLLFCDVWRRIEFDASPSHQ